MAARERYVRGACKTCGETISVSIGEMSLEQARDAIRERRGYECPGGGITPHQELGDLLSGYDWTWEVVEEEPPLSDEDFLQQLLDAGHDVLSGQRGRFKELPNLHDLSDLTHKGFGHFANTEYFYRRIDSPRDMRFYVREGLD